MIDMFYYYWDALIEIGPAGWFVLVGAVVFMVVLFWMRQ